MHTLAILMYMPSINFKKFKSTNCDVALCIADCLFPRRLLTGLPRDRSFVLLEFLAMQLCPFPNNSWHCIRRLSVKQVSEMTRKELTRCGKMIEVIPIVGFPQVCLSIGLLMSVDAGLHFF